MTPGYSSLWLAAVGVATLMQAAISLRPRQIAALATRCGFDRTNSAERSPELALRRGSRQARVIAVALLVAAGAARLLTLRDPHLPWYFCVLMDGAGLLLPVGLVLGSLDRLRFLRGAAAGAPVWGTATIVRDGLAAEVLRAFLAAKGLHPLVEPIPSTWGAPAGTAADTYLVRVPQPEEEAAQRLLATVEGPVLAEPPA